MYNSAFNCTNYLFCMTDCMISGLQFKIGLCQLSVTADKERNIAHARVAIEEAAEKGAKLVLLPVIFYYELLLFCISSFLVS